MTDKQQPRPNRAERRKAEQERARRRRQGQRAFDREQKKKP